MKKTPLLNTQLVQHMDVPRMPNVLMLDAGENLDDYVFLRGDLLDALSVNIYFNDIKTSVIDGFDVVTTKLRNHISDTHCHTNDTEKRYWNNKLDKSEYDEDLQVIQDRIKHFEDMLGNIDWSTVDLTSFITADQLAAALANIDWNAVNPDLSGYVKSGSVLGTINGVTFRHGGNITISGGSADLSNYVQKNGLKTINGQSLLGDGDITIGGGEESGLSYKVTNLSFDNNTLTLTQENNTAKTVTIPASSYTLPVASSTTLGGIKVGYINNGKNYKVLLDENNHAFVNVPWYPGEGGSGSTYDDSEIRGLIDLVNADLEALSNSIDSTVANTVEDRLADADWLRQNFPWGEVFHYDGWSTDIEAYLKTVGLIDENGSVGWTTLAQSVDSIAERVTRLERNQGGGSTMTGAEIIAALDSTNYPYTNMYSYYTRLNDDGNILKELVAGFKDYANNHEASAAQYARGVAENTDGIAALITTVETDLSGEIANVRSELAAKWSKNDGQEYVSGAIANATSDSAIASLFAQGTDTYAAVVAAVKGDEDTISLIADEVISTGDFLAPNGIFTGTLKIGGDNNTGVVVINSNISAGGTIKLFTNSANSGETSQPVVQIGDTSNQRGALNWIGSNGVGSFAGGRLRWDTTQLIVEGNIKASSFAVMNDIYKTVEFTYVTEDLLQNSGIEASGLEVGDPVGLIYKDGELAYFFDFAPVNNENFSATALTTYLITHGTGASTIDIINPRTYYRVDESGHQNEGKYVTSISSTAPCANVSYDDDRYVCRGTITLISGDFTNNRWYQMPCRVWRKIKIENGTLVKSYDEGYITPYTSEDTFTGYGIDSYMPNSSVSISQLNQNNFYTDSSYQYNVYSGSTYSFNDIIPIVRGYMGSNNGGTTAGTRMSVNTPIGWTITNVDLLRYENDVLQNAPEMPFVEDEEP